MRKRKDSIFFSLVLYRSLPLEFCGFWLTILHLVDATNRDNLARYLFFIIIVVGLTPSDQFVTTFFIAQKFSSFIIVESRFPGNPLIIFAW